MKTLDVIVGGQFGSEAKGHVTQRVTERRLRERTSVHVWRVAGPNAGHTGYDRTGRAWALRQVPVAAVVDGPVTLGIAPGSEIIPDVLIEEVSNLRAAGLLNNKFLWVSGSATLIEEEHQQRESKDGLVDKIGSTGKGIGAARADRIMRTAKRLIDDEVLIDTLRGLGVVVVMPASNPVFDTLRGDASLIIEGTQGYGLGLHTRYYPQVTSSNCRAIDFCAMAGVNPWQATEFNVWVVARIYPIRVAGNSGPLKGETTWEELGLPQERTTVTKKVRRVGEPDWELVREAVAANGPGNVRVAITMLDQLYSDLANTDIMVEESLGNHEVFDYLGWLMKEVGAPISMVTTGPNTASWI